MASKAYSERVEAREVLRRQREGAGISQEKLARLIGMATVTVSGYENGKFNPSRKAAQKMDDALEAGGVVMTAFYPPVTPLAALEQQVAQLASELATLQEQVARLLATLDD